MKTLFMSALTAAIASIPAIALAAPFFTPPADSPAPRRAASGAARVKSQTECPEGKSPDRDGGCSAKAPQPGEASIWVSPGCNGVKYRAWTGDETRVAIADQQFGNQGCRSIEYESGENTPFAEQ
jgi:hypothetical protein